MEPMIGDTRWQEWEAWERRKRYEEFCRWQETKGRDSNLDSQVTQGGTAGSESSGKDQTKSSGQPTGWAAMDKALREYDDETVKDYKEDIDNLLTFTGLFSGILASFLIESYPKLLANPSGGSFSDLRQCVAPTAHRQFQGNIVSVAASPHPSSSFRPAAGDIRVNVLWFASLLLSLIAASFGILVKQWLREYMSFKNPSPQARLRVRHLRYPALDRWWVFQIAAFLPILVHLSLALFFIGLVYFTASIHTSIEYTTLPLVSAWGLCFMVFAGLPLFFPRCPYRITILKDVYACIHRLVGWISNGARRWITNHRLPSNLRIDPREISASAGKWLTFWRRITGKWWAFWNRLFEEVAHVCDRVDEVEVAHLQNKDLKVLSDADDIQSNDELLITEIAEAARRVNLNADDVHPHAAPKFIHELLRNRLAVPQDDDDNCFSLILDLQETALSDQARTAIIDMILDFIPRLPSGGRLSDQICKQEDLNREIDVLQPRLLFALLLCLSRRPLREIPLLVTHLSQQKRGRAINSLCQKIAGSSYSGAQTSRSKHKVVGTLDVRVNLLRGISLVHRAVEARWSLTQALRSIGTIAQLCPKLDDSSISPHPPDSLITAQEHLRSLGFRAMRYVLSLESWIGKLDRAVVGDILKSLCDEVQNRTARRRLIAAVPKHTPDILMVDRITLDSLVTYICFQTWRPQWFRLEKCWSCILPSLLCEPDSRLLMLAMCSTPTLGVLRLCWRAASHSHSSGARVITGMDLKILSDWDKALEVGLKLELVNSDATHILKLLAFSLYLYMFSTSRLLDILKSEKQAWAKIFNQFTTSIQKLDAQGSSCDSAECHHRTPSSALATMCLELIRFDETLARILRRHVEDLACEQLTNYAKFRYTSHRMVDTALILGWCSAPLCSVFPEALISALERLVQPSWGTPIPGTEHKTMQFHNYCLEYEKRVEGLVSIKGTLNTWTWVRGHRGHSALTSS